MRQNGIHEKESTFVKADPELVEKFLRSTSYLESLLAIKA